MEWLLRDVRYALVTLRRTPGLTLTVLVTLALGVGATTAVFSVVHAVLLEGKPRRVASGHRQSLTVLFHAAAGHRTREIGIRMALGSDAAAILRLILNEAGSLVILGLAAGFGGAIALRGAIAAQLYGVGALDPVVMAGAVAILAATSLAACLGPARRAVQVSPLVALSRQWPAGRRSVVLSNP